MQIFQIIFLPILLGLAGFFEPCSLSINAIFLSYAQKLTKAERIVEGIIFLTVRATMLGIIGMLASVAGKKLFVFQQAYFIWLGAFITMLGVYEMSKKHLPIKFPSIWKLILPKKPKRHSAALLGILFGFVIPACAIPLILALLGTTLAIGSAIQGFFSLFLFGLALSLPLMVIVFFEKPSNLIKRLHAKMRSMPYMIGIILILLGIITIISSAWWG